MSVHAVPAARGEALRGHMAMLAFSVVVGGSFSMGSMIAGDIEPMAVNAARFLFAALVLAGAALVLPLGPRRGFRRSDFTSPWRWLVLGFLFAFYFVLMFEGFKTASALSIGAVFTLTPMLTAGVAWVILGQKLRLDVALVLLVGAVGAVWVIFRGDLARFLALDLGRGEAIYFVGCALHALFTPLMRRFNRGEPALVSTALVMAFGFVVLAVFGLRDLMTTDWLSLPPRVWLAMSYLVLFASSLAILLLQYGGQRLPASKVMAYSYLTPAWVILWELALGNPAPGLMVLPGVGLIVLTQILLLRED